MDRRAPLLAANHAACDKAHRHSQFPGPNSGCLSLPAMNVTFAEFQLSRDDSYIEGALIGDSGEIVGIRMHPDVACQLTRAMLMTTPAASSC